MTPDQIYSLGSRPSAQASSKFSLSMGRPVLIWLKRDCRGKLNLICLLEQTQEAAILFIFYPFLIHGSKHCHLSIFTETSSYLY